MDLTMLERNLTIVFEKPLSGLELSREELPENFKDAEARSGDGGQLYLSSFRTGIEMIFTPNRLIVRDVRNEVLAEDLVPRLALMVQRKTDASVRAYGLNYIAEFPVKGNKAGRFLAERLLNIGQIEKVLSVAGANVRLEHREGELKYRLSLEPRWQDVEHDHCYANLNIHHEGSLPNDEAELRQQFRKGEQWFIEHLTRLFPDVLGKE